MFRTYNASITLDRLLREMEVKSDSVTVDQKKADYDRANKEVSAAGSGRRDGLIVLIFAVYLRADA